MKGSGTPVRGKSFEIPAMFIKACKVIQETIPTAVIFANLFSQFNPALRPRQANKINNPIKKTEPI